MTVSSLLSKHIKIKIHRIVIVHVLYVCEVWAVTLRKEHGLGEFENRVLRGIFWAKGV